MRATLARWANCSRAVLDNLYRFVVPTVSGPKALVPLAALATTELSAPALRQAAMRGRLQAQRCSDGRWRSSRVWLEEYLASRYRRARHGEPGTSRGSGSG